MRVTPGSGCASRSRAATPAESEEIANALVRLLVARDALGFAAMSGYNHDVLAIAKRYAPELVLAPERLPDDVALDPAIAIGQARALDAPIIQVHHRFLTAGLVDTLHDAGIAVWSWPTTRGRGRSSAALPRAPTDSWATTSRRIVEVVDRERGRAI